MNINGVQLYKQYLCYLDNYVQVFENTYTLKEEETFFFGYNTEFFLTVLSMATELFESNAEPEQRTQSHIFL